jgi:hypothetical protein
MEPSGRNRWQPVAMGRARKPLKQADPQPVATHGNRFAAHGKEGVDGSSPSEGLGKVPANWHFIVVCPLNTRTHCGHICGTRDAARRFATPRDTLSRGRSRAHHRGNTCSEGINVASIGEDATPSHRRGGRRAEPPDAGKGPGTATPAGRCRRRVLSRRARGDGGIMPAHRLGVRLERWTYTSLRDALHASLQ